MRVERQGWGHTPAWCGPSLLSQRKGVWEIGGMVTPTLWLAGGGGHLTSAGSL